MDNILDNMLEIFLFHTTPVADEIVLSTRERLFELGAMGNQNTKEKRVKVLVVGLDCAGKSTILSIYAGE